MNPVHLGMGQSTVLRFQDKPRKIVLGNKNYYNLEFIKGQQDVTIQPLATVKTNLFVYTERKTYGFLLHPLARGVYDDLINVYWREKAQVFKARLKIVERAKWIRGNVILKRGLSATDFKVTRLRRIILVDFNIINRSQKRQNLQGLEVMATRGRKRLSRQSFAVNVDKVFLERGQTASLRLAVNLKQPRGFIVNIKLNGNNAKIIIPQKAL